MLPFLELDSAIVKDMITVNITAATYLCHQVTNLDDNTNDDVEDENYDHNEIECDNATYLCHQVINLNGHDNDFRDDTNDHDNNEEDITGARYLWHQAINLDDDHNSAEDDLDDNDDLDGVKDDNDHHPDSVAHTDCLPKLILSSGYNSFPQLLPAMIAKGKGAIINIASFGNFKSSPIST